MVIDDLKDKKETEINTTPQPTEDDIAEATEKNKESLSIQEDNQDYRKTSQKEQAVTLRKQLDENICPFDHKGYKQARAMLTTPEQRNTMRENFRIADGGEIEVFPIKKRISKLSSGVSEQYFSSFGDIKTSYGLSYFNGRAINNTARLENKKCFKTIEDIYEIIGYLPNGGRKRELFIALFDLSLTGRYIFDEEQDKYKLCDAGERGSIALGTNNNNEVLALERMPPIIAPHIVTFSGADADEMLIPAIVYKDC